MLDNRGPEARLRQRLEKFVEMLDALPDVLRNLGKLVEDWSEEGVVMHAETLAAHAERRWRQVFWLIAPLWLAGLSLAAIAVALLLGR
jgi:hypothetical protein